MFLKNISIFCLVISCLIVKSTENVIKNTEKLFPLSIVHINDFHARFEETNQQSAPCSKGEKCIGGYARLVTVVKKLLNLRKNQNPIYLNAGDSFQGTLWYNLGRWNVTSYFLNLLKADAMTLGNHEFDHGIAGVIPFLENIQSPMVVANIDDTDEPNIQGKYNKSVIVYRGGRKIGIIGVILQTTDEISNSGKLRFLNESLSVKKEAEKLKRNDKVDIIVVLSHCGLNVDRIIAQNAGPYIDIIVGGHSHTFLYSGKNLPGIEKPQDKYPVEVIQGGNHKVLIIQASAYAKYVGDLVVYFNNLGEIVSYEGAPIYLDTDVKPDKQILEELKPWKQIIDAEGAKEIGFSAVTLQKSNCNYEECNFGNLIADSMVHEVSKEINLKGENSDVTQVIGLINAGGIRTTLKKGVLTYAKLITALPFENTIITFDLLGEHLLEALELSVSKSWQIRRFNSPIMLQVSGLKIHYNVARPVGQRVVEVLVRVQSNSISKYLPLDIHKMYKIVVPSFLSKGGDGFKMFRDKGKNFKRGLKDIDVLINYIRLHSPIVAGNEGRIHVEHS